MGGQYVFTWPPEKPTATMPKSVPFLRNLGWIVGASIVSEVEGLAAVVRRDSNLRVLQKYVADKKFGYESM
jgi:hypothetical protein